MKITTQFYKISIVSMFSMKINNHQNPSNQMKIKNRK